jgi:Flp pilus assembly protein TadB
MTLSLYQLPVIVFISLPFVGAAALGLVGYLIGGYVIPKLDRSRTARLDMFADGNTNHPASTRTPVGSFNHRVRIAFAKVGIDASGKEEYYLMVARIAVGIAVTIFLMIVGLPFLTSLVGFLAGYVFINGWITRAWNKTRTEMEAEIPSLLMRLNATIQTDQNVPAALETVAKTLKTNGPLQVWVMEVVSRMLSEGYGAIQAIRDDAATISTSLAITAELLGRTWTTGGEGYAKAFGSAADNLESVLDARVLARAKGAGAQNTVNILMGATIGVIAFMTRSGSIGEIVRTPLVQALYAVITVLIVFGHSRISNMIDEAV